MLILYVDYTKIRDAASKRYLLVNIILQETDN